MEANYQQFTVKDIDPDPFRDLEGNPLLERKLTALRAEYGAVGFWGTLLARIGPDGRPQIAFGHHRLEALRQEFGPEYEVNLEIRDLSDEQMLQLMIQENRSDWDTDAGYELEAVRVAVEQHAAATIKLPPPSPRTPNSSLRYAPSFVLGLDVGGSSPEMAYTAPTVAEFLRWEGTKVKDTLRALELVELGVVEQKLFSGMPTSKARELTKAAGQAYEPVKLWIRTFDGDSAEAKREVKHRHREGVRLAKQAVGVVLEGAKPRPAGRPRRGVRRLLTKRTGSKNDERVAQFVDDAYDFFLALREVREFSSKLSEGGVRRVLDQLSAVRKQTDDLEAHFQRKLS